MVILKSAFCPLQLFAFIFTCGPGGGIFTFLYQRPPSRRFPADFMIMTSLLGQSAAALAAVRINYAQRRPRCADPQPLLQSLCVLLRLRAPGESCSQICPIFLLFYRWSSGSRRRRLACGGVNGRGSMNSQCYTVAMDLGVCQLRNFSISFLSSVLGKESASVRVDNR